jgi:hypothetical protein
MPISTSSKATTIKKIVLKISLELINPADARKCTVKRQFIAAIYAERGLIGGLRFGLG